MLASTIELFDIDDVEGFVCATIERSGLRTVVTENEREDLIAAGLEIMFRLAAQFEPHRPGYAQAGRFSGFAAQFLPRRLGDEWHKWHPEHRRVTDADGKRRWVYSAAPVSLNEVLETDRTDTAHGPLRQNPETTFRPREHWAPIAVPA